MRRLLTFVAAAILSAILVITGAPTASAQPINCGDHLWDATVEQGIYLPMLGRQIDSIRKISPDADIYAQAYQNAEGISFNRDEIPTMCANWLDPSGTRLKDNLILVIYARDVDRVVLYTGFSYQAAVWNKYETIMNGVNSGLGPELSQKDPNYATSAMTDALSATKFYMEMSGFYKSDDGMYHSPTRIEQQQSDTFEPFVLIMWIAAVVAGFTAFGIVCSLISAAFRQNRQ